MDPHKEPFTASDGASSRPSSRHPDDGLRQDTLEAIAVIGFSLRMPQEAVTPQKFWTMLEEKRCTMTEWPRDRINLDAFYHPDPERRDTVRLSQHLG